MKLIVAKRSGLDEIAYINASRINSFHVTKNPYDGRIETKIYFTEGKCEIEGDMTYRIACFMSDEGDSGVLDLVSNIDKRGYWDRKETTNGDLSE